MTILNEEKENIQLLLFGSCNENDNKMYKIEYNIKTKEFSNDNKFTILNNITLPYLRMNEFSYINIDNELLLFGGEVIKSNEEKKEVVERIDEIWSLDVNNLKWNLLNIVLFLFFYFVIFLFVLKCIFIPKL